MKIRPVGAEFFHADRRTDMTKLIVAFRSFADTPKKRQRKSTGHLRRSIPTVGEITSCTLYYKSKAKNRTLIKAMSKEPKISNAIGQLWRFKFETRNILKLYVQVFNTNLIVAFILYLIYILSRVMVLWRNDNNATPSVISRLCLLNVLPEDCHCDRNI
jgi:hypothetical protein